MVGKDSLDQVQKLELALKEKDLELKEANKELEAFAFTVSHEFRSPLNHIEAFLTRLLKTFGQPSADQERFANIIYHSVTEMRSLMHGLMQNFRSGHQVLEMAMFDLKALFEEVAAIQIAQESGRTIQWSCQDLGQVYGDRQALKIVAQNLLSNAFKFTKFKEFAYCNVTKHDEDKEQCTVTICIADNGAGFSSQETEKIFTPFSRLHRQDKYPGAGLGLASAARLIERHGGRAWAEGETDQGAKIFISLPTRANREVAPQASNSRSETEPNSTLDYQPDFIDHLAHDLRSPLNSISILSKLLASNSSGNLTEKQVRNAEGIHSAGDSLLALINQVIDLARVDLDKIVLTKKPFPSNNLVDNLMGSFVNKMAKKNLQFIVEKAEGVPETIHADQQRIEQIIYELLNNAMKYTEKGTIRVLIENDLKQGIMVHVIDTGIGIPIDQIEKVFEPFVRIDGPLTKLFNGNGIGLTWARKLAHRMGGGITLSSEVSKGSRFTVSFPL